MSRDEFTKSWITQNAIDVLGQYEKGILTIRGLHYQLVSMGMTNSIRHYKRVVAAMIDARWAGLVDFDAFSDLDRSMVGATEYDETNLEQAIEDGKNNVKAWMDLYYKNRWENQPYYPEVFIEKKALQGVFQGPCERHRVALGACKGYPSLTFLNEAAERFTTAARNGKKPVIIYFGDYDPSGEDIPRAIEENMRKLGCTNIEVRRIALMKHQVIEWRLPPAPAKETDSRTANWDGLGQVELDAVKPERLQRMCTDAINELFDNDLYDELCEQEEEERSEYRAELLQFVSSL